MPNAVCGALEGRGRPRPRHPHRDARRRHDRPRRGRPRDRRAQDASTRCQIVFTFAAGSRKQYDFIDRNPRARSRARSTTPTCPTTSCRTTRVVSINNTTQIDLQGQAASESSGHRHITRHRRPAPVRARRLRLARRQVVHLPLVDLRARTANARAASSATLTPGNVVTTPRTDVMYVVTEYGLVNLEGKSVAQRARALIVPRPPRFPRSDWSAKRTRRSSSPSLLKGGAKRRPLR